MKKVIVFAFMVACATFVMANERPNAVAYNTITLHPGTNQVGVSFVNIGGRIFDLQEFIPGTTTGLVSGSTAATADNIRFWNNAANRYEVYFLHDGVADAALKQKWVAAGGTQVGHRPLQPHDAFMYVYKGTAPLALTVTGEAFLPPKAVKAPKPVE